MPQQTQRQCFSLMIYFEKRRYSSHIGVLMIWMDKAIFDNALTNEHDDT